MVRKIKTDGMILKLVNQLKGLIDEASDFKAIGQKYRALERIAKKLSVENLLGTKHWKELQELIKNHPEIQAARRA